MFGKKNDRARARAAARTTAAGAYPHSGRNRARAAAVEPEPPHGSLLDDYVWYCAQIRKDIERLHRISDRLCGAALRDLNDCLAQLNKLTKPVLARALADHIGNTKLDQRIRALRAEVSRIAAGRQRYGTPRYRR